MMPRSSLLPFHGFLISARRLQGCRVGGNKVGEAHGLLVTLGWPLCLLFTRADSSTGLYSCLFILQVSSQRSQMQPFWVSQQHCPHSLTPTCKTSMRSFSSVTHLNSIPSQFIMMYLGDGFISLFPCLINWVSWEQKSIGFTLCNISYITPHD